MSGPNTVFCYGTLMAPEVFFSAVYGAAQPLSVVRQLHTFRPAVLRDYCRHRVRAADYPGIVPEEGQTVRGVLVSGLTDANVGKLDHFEGSEYVRRTVKVEVDNKEKGVEETEADVYVFINPNRLERGEWDFDHFLKERLRMWSREEFIFNECIGEPAKFDDCKAKEVSDEVLKSAV